MDGSAVGYISPLHNTNPNAINSGSPRSRYHQHTEGGDGSSQGTDRVSISSVGRNLSQTTGQDNNQATGLQNQESAEEANLTTAELTQLRQLKARDTEVRTHEQAHLTAAGQYAASGANFTFQLGPDGKRYAVGGEVQIDIGKESTPEATLQKMEVIARAALAPASPSSADRQIAAQAAIKAAQARQEIIKNERAEGGTGSEEIASPTREVSAAPEQENRSSGADTSAPVEGPSPATLKAVIDTYKSIQELV